MRWVAHYLHTAGWNVYSTILAGHAFKGDAWPQVHIKAAFGGDGALTAAVATDPALSAAVANPGAAMGSPAQLFEQLGTAVPQLAAAGPPDAYLAALEGGPTASGASRGAFDARFDSTAGAYGEVAEAALRLVDEAGLPGPVVAVGSSVGGAAAVWLGGVAPPGRVSHVLACAPLLRLHGTERRRLTLMMGPLGVGPEQGWSADNKFALSCLTGTLLRQWDGCGGERGGEATYFSMAKSDPPSAARTHKGAHVQAKPRSLREVAHRLTDAVVVAIPTTLLVVHVCALTTAQPTMCLAAPW